MISDNLLSLRKLNRMTQEDVAEKIGVSRQAIAKWENGETMPDIQKCSQLAELFGVSLDDLVHLSDAPILPARQKGKHIFGVVTMGDRGQIVIPRRARKVFDLNPGDRLLVLGDEAQGLAMVKEKDFMNIVNAMRQDAKED